MAGRRNRCGSPHHGSTERSGGCLRCCRGPCIGHRGFGGRAAQVSWLGGERLVNGTSGGCGFGVSCSPHRPRCCLTPSYYVHPPLLFYVSSSNLPLLYPHFAQHDFHCYPPGLMCRYDELLGVRHPAVSSALRRVEGLRSALTPDQRSAVAQWRTKADQVCVFGSYRFALTEWIDMRWAGRGPRLPPHLVCQQCCGGT